MRGLRRALEMQGSEMRFFRKSALLGRDMVRCRSFGSDEAQSGC